MPQLKYPAEVLSGSEYDRCGSWNEKAEEGICDSLRAAAISLGKSVTTAWSLAEGKGEEVVGVG